MPALPIIEHHNVLEDVRCRVFTGGVVPMVHELTLECPEEALLGVASCNRTFRFPRA